MVLDFVSHRAVSVWLCIVIGVTLLNHPFCGLDGGVAPGSVCDIAQKALDVCIDPWCESRRTRRVTVVVHAKPADIPRRESAAAERA